MYSKGGALLCEAIRIHLNNHPKDTFLVHICGLSKEEAASFYALPEQSVELVSEYRNGSDYFAHIMSGDIALIPYSPQGYELRTSHILLEALGSGRAVITAKHPWMMELLRTLPKPSGVLMEEWSPNGLSEAMSLMHHHSLEYRKNAFEQSSLIRKTHNAEEWWRFIQ